MATSSFYNDNLYRTYPFVAADHSKIPNEWLAGIKVCFRCGAGFPSFPSVFLVSWHTESGQTVLKFSCEAGSKIVQKTVAIPTGTTVFSSVRSDEESGIQVILIVGYVPLPDVQLLSLRLKVEPTCILWLQHRGISSVQVGNRPRKVLPLPDGVDHEYYGNVDWWSQGERFTGPLLFKPGFNCRIHQRTSNRLQIEASVNAGAGEVTEDFSKGCIDLSGTIVCEESPVDYLRKDGLPNEENVLYAFCGAVGPHVRMIAASTIILTIRPEEHTVIISVGNLGGGAC